MSAFAVLKCFCHRGQPSQPTTWDQVLPPSLLLKRPVWLWPVVNQLSVGHAAAPATSKPETYVGVSAETARPVKLCHDRDASPIYEASDLGVHEAATNTSSATLASFIDHSLCRWTTAEPPSCRRSILVELNCYVFWVTCLV